MWMNLHDLPAGKSMYTVAITADPVDLPHDERTFEELDFIASSRATVADILKQADIEALRRDYDGGDALRFVGVINQSDGYVMQENWEGIA